MKYYLFFYITIAISHQGFAQDGSLNDDENFYLADDESAIPESPRTPFYMKPQRCPENMIAYPGPGIDSPWICGCKPRLLYFSSTNSCYEAFRQGPCPPEHYVHLAVGDVMPRCAPNPCIVDGLVLFKGVCYPLQQFGAPCANNGFLYVNERTYQVECTPIVKTRSSSYVIVKAPPTATICPPDTRPDPSAGCKIPIP